MKPDREGTVRHTEMEPVPAKRASDDQPGYVMDFLDGYVLFVPSCNGHEELHRHGHVYGPEWRSWMNTVGRGLM